MGYFLPDKVIQACKGEPWEIRESDRANIGPSVDYYEILGVNTRQFREAEIMKAYRQMALQYHPGGNKNPRQHGIRRKSSRQLLKHTLMLSIFPSKKQR
jgi:hypothetical protein